MGRPFDAELQQFQKTITWARELDVKNIQEFVNRYRDPVYIIGSGGSFSACVFAADLLTSKGVFAKAVTPLELYYASATIRKSNLLFISASGNNTDILFAFKKAIESEPLSIVSICMRKNSKLADLASKFSSCSTFEFTPPTGKDGFLATNTLVSYFIILYRAIISQEFKQFDDVGTSNQQSFISKTNKRTNFTILYGSYNQAVAVDLESKFSEAGLASSSVSDYRHFAHGRHNWFDKQPDSAIIALSCPADEKLCHKTLGYLPTTIPQIILETKQSSFEGTIGLLIQSMQLISLFGEKINIDPGRPGVPDYGSKIYHLKYERLVSEPSIKHEELAIIRKAKVNRIADLTESEYQTWMNSYKSFKKTLNSGKFGALIFDYDGTLCSATHRYTGPGEDVKNLLIDFAKKGFVLGIVSGRGESLREELEKIFKGDKKLTQNVIVGYYNGSDIAPLADRKHPIKSGPMHPTLDIIYAHMKSIGINGELRPNQLTFEASTSIEWARNREILLNEIMLLDKDDITLVESSHSLDVIPRKIASKNLILKHCKKLCKQLGLSEEMLCIGDKGQWPGNDYALLANKYAISVREVSSKPESGWNICPAGLRDEKAVNYLFEKIDFHQYYFNFSKL